MEKSVQGKTVWQFTWSLLLLACYIWLAMVSFPSEHTTYLGDGVYHTAYKYDDGFVLDNKFITGRRDEKKRWHGPVVIVHEYYTTAVGSKDSKEEVTMVNGLRHGVSKKTFIDGRVEYVTYNMGKVIEESKSERSVSTNESAFQVLHRKYPWYILALDGYNHSVEAIEAFVEIMIEGITALEYSFSEFDMGFDEVLDDLLDDEDYSLIASTHRFLADIIGVQEIMNHEFRLAVLDKHQMDGMSTAEVVAAYYPGYFNWVQRFYSVSEFELFCDTLDAMMLSYGQLDREDPLFLDSIDTRFYRVLSELVFSKSEFDALVSQAKSEGSRSTLPSRSALHRMADELAMGKATSSTVVTLARHIAQQMDRMMKQVDPVRTSIREIMYSERVRRAEIITLLISVDVETDIVIEGFVLDDGGADVTERGVAYGTLYNPTVDDTIITSGEGTGKFLVTISGFEPDARLFARAYARNSAGVSYGNQVEFVPSVVTGLSVPDNPELTFDVFPVPARDRLWVRTSVVDAGMGEVSLINMSGQLIRSQRVNLGQSQNVAVDIAGIQPGVYFVRLTLGSSIAVRQVIVQ